jgi:nicotinate-nucleotide pyrophosphorylase (carboxylating)
MTLAGLGLIPMVLNTYGTGWRTYINFKDGETVSAGAVIAKIEGPVQKILTAERVLLNYIQKLSRIATLTKSYVDAIGSSPAPRF